METIKCQTCGCVMSAMSEACPLCGTPTVNAICPKSVVDDTVVVNEERPSTVQQERVQHTDTPQIAPRTLHPLETCNTLEEAIILAMGHRKLNPCDTVYIYPVEAEGVLESYFYNEGGVFVGNIDINNRPTISVGYDGEELLMTIADCTRHSDTIRNNLLNRGVTNVDVEYNFVLLSDSLNDSFFHVELYLNENAPKLASEVEMFNQKVAASGSRLTLDIANKTLIGDIKKYSEKGGIFEKKKTKKANQEIVDLFLALIKKATPCFERN